MRLVSLLAAGKSVVGLNDGASPYRMTNQRLLPKFGWEPAPTYSAAKAPPLPVRSRVLPPAAGGTVAPTVQPERETGCPARRDHGSHEAAGPGKSALKAPSRGRPMVRAGASKLERALRRLAGRLSAFSLGARRKPAQSPIPRFTKPMVQGELSLDRVKVVHNDLTDADLEHVRLTRSARAGLASPAVVNPASSGLAWLRAAGRFFRPSRTG